MIGFDLTPPEETQQPIDRLAKWGIQPVYKKDEKVWLLPGVENWGDDVSIGYLMDEPEADQGLLTSRDLGAVEHIINNVLEADAFEIGQEIWEPRLDRYSDRGDGGPSVNVKLDTYEFWNEMERVTGIDIGEHEVDPEGWIWNDTTEREMEWFKDQYLDDYPALDPDKFIRLGRQGGHLVYNIQDGALTFGEAEQLEKLWEEIPSLIRGVSMEVVANLWSHVFETSWEKVVDKWRKREQKAVAKCIRKGTFERASWHQANLDAENQMNTLDYTDAFEMVWMILYAYEKIHNPQPE